MWFNDENTSSDPNKSHNVEILIYSCVFNILVFDQKIEKVYIGQIWKMA